MLQSGSLSSIYDEAKVNELQDAEELSGKDQKKLDDFLNNKPLYDSILEALFAAASPERYMSEKSFIPVLTAALAAVTSDKKLIAKIAYGLSVMDKEAEIQRDKKGNIIYDKDSKDTELVGYEEDIDEYMQREVLPYVPDAKAFFEENMGAKKPVIKTGAEIPFTRTFYRYQAPTASEDLEHRFIELEEEVTGIVSELFGQRR